MASITRNAMKGYSYQQTVFSLFLSLMDTQRNIEKIVIEAPDTKNFDDIYLENVKMPDESVQSYRIQVKNYYNVNIDEITVTDEYVSIKGNRNEYEQNDNNILIVNSSIIETDDSLFGLPAVKKDNITIIPIEARECYEIIDEMFNSDERALQIIHKANEIVQESIFEISIDKLPQLIRMSVDLEENTVLVRKVPEEISYGVTLVEGKPGVGKSHYAKELINRFPEAIMYRFWTGSQDRFSKERLRFQRFIDELGIIVFGSSKRVVIDELIKTIQDKDLIIIIDGLDHVENYNKSELELFISFIERLKGVRCIVLSRPIKRQVDWERKELLNWNFEEVRFVLETKYQITDYRIHPLIFEYTDGYPIITHFIAEEYNNTGELNIGEEPLKSIEDYYNKLFDDDKPSEAMSVFAVGNVFFTWKELEGFYDDPELYYIVEKFIHDHPYLFRIMRNRVSFIHDSLNTYIRTHIDTYHERKKSVYRLIENSLLDGSSEYFDRMDSFDFEDSFYEKMIKEYSDFSKFKDLIKSTLDYNSISSLYSQLLKKLAEHSELLSVTQLYTFALLIEISQRNDLMGSNSLVVQMIDYMLCHEGIEDLIFSSGYIWNVYLAFCGESEYTRRFLENNYYSDYEYYDLMELINEKDNFFEKSSKKINYEELIELIKKPGNKLIYQILIEYFVCNWINKSYEEKFYNEFQEYLLGNDEAFCSISEELSEYNVSWRDVRLALREAKYHLHELGFFGDDNWFRNSSLIELIKYQAKNGSFDVEKNATSYIRLANHEQRNIDIENISFVWTMYAQRKDYSVYNIEKALMVFEKKELINEDVSFEIIEKLMEQSEKGIAHLATSYTNKKGIDFTNKLRKRGYFLERNTVNFWDLNPELIDCMDDYEMDYQIEQLVGRYWKNKKIEYSKISKASKSKYKDKILDIVKCLNYSLIFCDKTIIEDLKERKIDYEMRKEESDDYVPFKSGCIHEEDFKYIRDNGVSIEEVAGYVAANGSCLPFVEVYNLFEKKEVQKRAIQILHSSMFAFHSNGMRYGNWYLLLGNIIDFLFNYEISVDYTALYSVFNEFLDLSLIWREK